MSIFKETLPKFIIDQLTIREAIVKMGNDVTPDGAGNIPSPRTASPRVTLKGSEKKITIDSSAFFTNAISKQCVLRMSSGVDVKPGTFPQFPNEPTGVKLSQRFVLEGGIPTEDLIKVEDEDNNIREVRVPRGGFARGKGSAYGDSGIRSSARDGFGIVPMPGITDANIRTKTAYGSLRDAKVNFICHIRDQLEILELLYMRPGYPVLLEWGWLPYINNDGRRENFFPYMKEWWEENTTMDQINEKIIKQKEQSGGNYDAMNGIVKNFEMKARADGGYDCSCELISMGEVLEGLKGRASEEDATKYRNKKTSAPINAFLSYLIHLREISSSYDVPQSFLPGIEKIIEEIIVPNSEEVTADPIPDPEDFSTYDLDRTIPEIDEDVASLSIEVTQDPRGSYVDEPSPTGGGFLRIYEDGSQEIVDAFGNPIFEQLEADIAASLAENNEDVENTVNEETEPEPVTSTTSKNYDINKVFKPFIIKSSEYLSTKDKKPDRNSAGFKGVSWDLIVEIYNHFIVPQTKPPSPQSKTKILNSENEDVNIKPAEPETLGAFNYYEKNTNKYLTYNKVTFPTGFKASSNKLLNKKIDSNKLLGSSLDKNICLFPHQFNRFVVWEGNVDSKEGLLGVSEAEISDYSIGKIFFNIDYLIDTFEQMFYDKVGVIDGFGFLDYFKKIWEQDVNESCANQHNFVVHVPPDRNNKIKVIDYDIQTLDVKVPVKTDLNGKQTPAQFSGIRAKDIFEFKIQSNESIVRDFTFNTSIPANMASIISIAAQAPNDIGSLDEVSFAAFSKNIKSRFTVLESTKTTEDFKKQWEASVNKLSNSMSDLLDYLEDMYSSYTNDEENSGISLASAKDLVKNMESLIFKVTSTDYSGKAPTYKRKTSQIPAKSAVIPLRFNARMDGIGGMVIGNVFKVDKTRLPRGYQEDDVAFIITTEQQNITVGQDWTTDITGQLMLLDLEKERVELDGEISDEIDINLSVLSPQAQAAIDNLNITPGVKERFIDFILDIEGNTEFTVDFRSNIRSIPETVDLIRRYEEGDTSIVVRPAAPGRSLHNYGLAMDINLISPTGEYINSKSSDEEWKPVVDIAKKYGLRWGGTFKARDAVHFDLPEIPGSSYVHPRDKDYLIPFLTSEQSPKGAFPNNLVTNPVSGELTAEFVNMVNATENLTENGLRGELLDFRNFDKEALKNISPPEGLGTSKDLEAFEDAQEQEVINDILQNSGGGNQIPIDPNVGL